MIRNATENDFEQILNCCELFWQFTAYDEAFERDHVRRMVEMCHDHGLLAVLDDGGVQGFIAAVKGPLLGNSSVLTGTELAWWVNEDYRKGRNGLKLVRHLENEARKQGVKYWNMIAMESSMPEEVGRLYEMMGYIHTESSYTKVL